MCRNLSEALASALKLVHFEWMLAAAPAQLRNGDTSGALTSHATNTATENGRCNAIARHRDACLGLVENSIASLAFEQRRLISVLTIAIEASLSRNSLYVSRTRP
jgi:hypothetical protein